MTFAAVLQSIGFELTIFVITVALAIAFRGATSGKKASFSAKAGSVPVSKASSPDGVGRAPGNARGSVGSGVKRTSAKAAPASAARHEQVPSDDLSQQIFSMLDCASRRQPVDALAIYDELKLNGKHTAIKDFSSAKHSPIDVFAVLVQCAGRAGKTELVEPLLEDMTLAGVDRTLAFYESAMKMLASKKCYKEAMRVCTRLEADGLTPSPTTLSCLINFAVEIGELDRAIAFFERLSATDMPSIRAYMTILRVYSKHQDWPKSLAVLREMQRREAPIDSLVLNVVLSTGVAVDQLDATKAVLKEFADQGIADVVSYNTLMKGFAKHMECHRAIQLLNDMCKSSVKPNAITFNTAMDAAVRSSRISDAWSVLARMCEAGLAPDKFTCTTLMKGLQNGATSEQLTMILDLLRNVNSACDPTLCGHLFRTVIELTATVNDPHLTSRAVAQMREQRVMLPAQEYQRLLQVLLRGQDGKQWPPCHPLRAS